MFCRVDAAVPRIVSTDAGRLRQVLINLVGNALKFTDQGEVEIRVDAEDSGADETILHFCVRDTGRGIPPEYQQRIFEAFVQADGSMKRAHGGSGFRAGDLLTAGYHDARRNLGGKRVRRRKHVSLHHSRQVSAGRNSGSF
jgi:light-regulated signal transduction histidine kinase (bacteriophytochrome)